MRKIVFLLTALCLSMSAWSQDGLVYWSQADGYKFDFDLDGTVDFSLPTQTTDKAISQVFVFDANGDGYFDLCELDLNDNLINWIFYYNDGNNNFVDPQTVIYGMSEGDKKLAGDFNGDGIGDVGIRRDNEFGLWWLITFQAMAPDVNQQFGISDKDLLVAGDMNGDGQDDIVCYDKGSWLCSFTPSDTEYKTPDFVSKDVHRTIYLCCATWTVTGMPIWGCVLSMTRKLVLISIVRRKLQITDIAAIMGEVLSIRLYLCLRV